MSTSLTDRQLSMAATEFVWDSDGLNSVHKLVMPVVTNWLNARTHWSLIDIGCGNGAFTNLVAPLVTNVVGVDASNTGIEIARSAYPEIEFTKLSIEDPISAELKSGFDGAMSIEVIEHLLLPRQLFVQAKSVLKPGGEFLISTPYHGYLKNLAIAITGKFDKHCHPCRDYGHVKFFSIKTISALCDEQGFDVLKIFRIGRIPPLACSMVIQTRLR